MDSIMIFAIPFFFLTIGIEMLVGFLKKKRYYDFKDAITNLNIGIGSQTVGLVSQLLILGGYALVHKHLHIFNIPINNVFVWIGTLIVFDGIYYWAHRWAHEWNIMWGAHIVHHQSDEFNLSVALRQSWIHGLLSFWMFLPLAIIGVPVEVMAGISGIVTLAQYWIHTEAIKKMPRWFEFIMNTPSHHRVHHATNPQYLDKNYGATFIIWDRMFGTFEPEVEKPVYGITVGHESLDPVYANVHYYKEMIIGAKKEKGLWNKFKLIFRSPAYLGGLIQDYYKAQPKKEKTPVNLNMKIYVLIQFLALSFGLVLFINEFKNLSLFYQISGIAMIIFTIQSCGYILENKTKLFPLEIARLIMAAILLNAVYYEWYQVWFMLTLVVSIIIASFSTFWFIYENYIKRKDPLKVSNS